MRNTECSVFAMVVACARVADICMIIVQTTAYHNFVFAPPSHQLRAMDKSRRASAPWSSHSSRRDDDKRRRDEFDHVEDIVAKKKRELSCLKEDADRLRRERNKMDAENDRLRAENERLRAESDRKSAALAQLEQQLTKRFKTALDDAFEEVLGTSVMNEAAATDPSEEDGAAPPLLGDTNTPANGPGDAAPAPQRGEEEKTHEEALEQAVHSSDTPQPSADNDSAPK